MPDYSNISHFAELDWLKDLLNRVSVLPYSLRKMTELLNVPQKNIHNTGSKH